MDPATVFGVAGTSARVAMTACSLGEALFALIKDAKTVDQTLVTLAMQTRTVKELCLSVAKSIQRAKRNVGSYPYPARTSHGKHITSVLRAIEEQLVDCEQTLECLCRSTQGIRIGNTRPTERMWVQIKFNLNKDAMIEARTQLSLHLLTLNTSLQVLSLDSMIITPRHSVSESEQELDACSLRMIGKADNPTKQEVLEENSLLTLRGTFSNGQKFPNQIANGGSATNHEAFRAFRQTEAAKDLLGERPQPFAYKKVCSSSPGKFESTVNRGGSDIDIRPSPEDNKTTSYAEAQCIDFIDHVDQDLVEGVIQHAISAYRTERYRDAKRELLNILEAIDRLPSHFRRKYDVYGLRYMHAVSTYHSTELASTRCALSEFLRDPTTTDHQNICRAHAASLLACVCIDLGDPEAGRLAAVLAVDMARNSSIIDYQRLDGYLAVLARTETLLHNFAEAENVGFMISSSRRDLLTRYCARYPHKQGLDLDTRKRIAQNEHSLFANARLCEQSGKVDILRDRKSFLSGLFTRRDFLSDPDCRNHKVTSLHFAALFGDLEAVRELIEAGADVNAEAYVAKFFCLRWNSKQPLTPLACALLLRHSNIVRILVHEGARFMDRGGTSVAAAIANKAFVRRDGHSLREILECLKHLGWDINKSPYLQRCTLMHHAAQTFDAEDISVLISCGASPLQRDDRGNIPLHTAIVTKGHGVRVSKVVAVLLQQEREAQLNSRNDEGMTPLHVVTRCRYASEHVALALLKAGADARAKDRQGRVPYHWLQSRWDWTAVSRFLIQS